MAQINLIHLVGVFPSHFRFLTPRHSVRAFSENDQNSLLLTSFPSNIEKWGPQIKGFPWYQCLSTERRGESHPLDRFNLNGQIFHLPSSFLPLQRKWLTQIQEYVFSQLARQLCSVPLSAKLYPIHRRACHTNRQPHTYKKRFQEIIKPDNMWKGCFQSSCYNRIWVRAYDTRQWIYESLRYQPTNQMICPHSHLLFRKWRKSRKVKVQLSELWELSQHVCGAENSYSH